MLGYLLYDSGYWAKWGSADAISSFNATTPQPINTPFVNNVVIGGTVQAEVNRILTQEADAYRNSQQATDEAKQAQQNIIALARATAMVEFELTASAEKLRSAELIAMQTETAYQVALVRSTTSAETIATKNAEMQATFTAYDTAQTALIEARVIATVQAMGIEPAELKLEPDLNRNRTLQLLGVATLGLGSLFSVFYGLFWWQQKQNQHGRRNKRTGRPMTTRSLDAEKSPQGQGICPLCKGTGEVIMFAEDQLYKRQLCQKCRGSGFVSAEETPPPQPPLQFPRRRDY